MKPADMPVGERREKAMASALRLLSSRERSEMEIRLKLAQKGFDRETIIATIDRLQTAGLQDDSRFAEVFASQAGGRRGLAGSAIRGELRGRGIGSELAARAAAVSPEEEEARARAVATKRSRAMENLPPETARRRLEGFLARRGYPGELSRRIARDLFGDAAE